MADLAVHVEVGGEVICPIGSRGEDRLTGRTPNRIHQEIEALEVAANFRACRIFRPHAARIQLMARGALQLNEFVLAVEEPH